MRPVKEFESQAFRFSWVKEQLELNNYDTVQKLFDEPYERDPGPTKIPAGALEFRRAESSRCTANIRLLFLPSQ